jgi:hypothetical protein
LRRGVRAHRCWHTDKTALVHLRDCRCPAAAELVKGATPTLQPYVLDNYFRLDTFGTPNPAFCERRGKEASRRCICWEQDFVDTYREKYSSEAAR